MSIGNRAKGSSASTPAHRLALAAAAGIVAGAAACRTAGETPESTVTIPKVDVAREEPTAEAIASTAEPTVPRRAVYASKEDDPAPPDRNCCKGKNECKGKGNCKTDRHACKGKNDCKGMGGCKAAQCDQPSRNCCKGMNDCKALGMCKTDKSACKGQNACKGQGGCKPSDC